MKTLTILAPLSIALATSLSLFSCTVSPSQTSSVSPQATTKLVLTGSSTVAPVASEIAKRFESEHPGVRIDVQSGGSSRGIADARQGTADIGMVSRSLKDTEKDLHVVTIAKDGITVILHQDNPVRSLTNQQIIDIYTNKINNWQEVGGKDAPITVINKAEGRSTLELFAEYFKLKTTSIQPDVVIGDNEQGIKTVAGNANSIAYVSIGSAESALEHKTSIKLLPINGIEASTSSIQNDSFPITRPLNFVTKTEPTGLAKEFIDFARSNKTQDIVQQQYFVPVSQPSASQSHQSWLQQHAY
jgi:phosphate transport system substrate-binding protein